MRRLSAAVDNGAGAWRIDDREDFAAAVILV
jgi:hypothetical protein